MRHIISVDPGKTTGLSYLTWDGDQDKLPLVQCAGEVDEFDFAALLIKMINLAFAHEGGPTSHVEIVCEKFTITVQTAKNSQAPYSLEQIGVLKHLCREHGISSEKIHFQTPADAKAMFPNEALKKVDIWYVGGEGHANDSIRHALLYLVKTGWKPKILLT